MDAGVPMTTKQDMLDAIHDVADAVYNNDNEDAVKRRGVYIAAGTPGDKIKIEGKWYHSGMAFTDGPKTLDVVIEGIADFLDSQFRADIDANTADIATLTSKLNEVITSLNQFIDDYNAPIPIQPTTASKVTTL